MSIQQCLSYAKYVPSYCSERLLQLHAFGALQEKTGLPNLNCIGVYAVVGVYVEDYNKTKDVTVKT